MSQNAPAQFPDNALTRVIERGSQGMVEAPVTFGEQPRVRSAAMTRLPAQPPLTAEENAEADARLIELGIMPGAEPEEGSAYASQAEAEAAGQPVNNPAEVAVVRFEGLDAKDLFVRPGRVIPVAGLESYPRLPDFTKPGVLHLGLGVVYLDGLEFPIPAADLKEFRKYVVQTVHQNLTDRLNSALAAVSEPEEATDAGAPADNEEVQPVREDEGSGSVQPTEIA